jgi:hypothetical protein
MVGTMEIKPVHFVIALGVLFIALLVVFPIQGPASVQQPAQIGPQESARAAEDLYMKAVSFGEHAGGYVYSYTEYTDGFPENYTISSDGENASVEVSSALSDKKAYFLVNDTIFCVGMGGNTTCASVKNQSAAAGYMATLRSRLFSDGAIGIARLDAAYRINRSLQVFSPAIRTMVLPGGAECIGINYTIEYSGATLGELNRFGIGSGSPSLFHVSECIDNQTGEIHRYNYDYVFQGSLHTYGFSLISSDFLAVPQILAPADLSGDVIDQAFQESAVRHQLLGCYPIIGDDSEKCVATLALQQKSAGLCSLAGTRRDRCLVSLMPYLRDPAICRMISTPEFTDDCYIELGGAFKNATWCGYVSDATKKSYCAQVSSPVPPAAPVPAPAQNVTQEAGNQTQNGSATLPPIIAEVFKEMEQNGTGANYTGNGTINSTG